MTVNTVGKYFDSQLPTFFFLGIPPDSVTSSNKCIFLIQTSTLRLPGNLGSCQAPKPANDDEMALLQSGRGFSLCSLPRLNPLPIQRESSRGTGDQELARIWLHFHLRKPESEEQG